MAAMNLWKRGSKRRVLLIRWKRSEIVHLVLLALVMTLFCIWVGVWIATHHFD